MLHYSSVARDVFINNLSRCAKKNYPERGLLWMGNSHLPTQIGLLLLFYLLLIKTQHNQVDWQAHDAVKN
jgi:hypothetical protein